MRQFVGKCVAQGLSLQSQEIIFSSHLCPGAEDGRAADGRGKDGRAEDGRAEDGRAEDGRAEDGRAEDGRRGEQARANRGFFHSCASTQCAFDCSFGEQWTLRLLQI
jgi:hypothetical protein